MLLEKRPANVHNLAHKYSNLPKLLSNKYEKKVKNKKSITTYTVIITQYFLSIDDVSFRLVQVFGLWIPVLNDDGCQT